MREEGTGHLARPLSTTEGLAPATRKAMPPKPSDRDQPVFCRPADTPETVQRMR